VQADDPANVVAKLADQKIIVTKKPQGIRVAAHFFNNEADIERLIEALSSMN
jgi:selenocysteine lyase/cysteine desulfurase